MWPQPIPSHPMSAMIQPTGLGDTTPMDMPLMPLGNGPHYPLSPELPMISSLTLNLTFHSHQGSHLPQPTQARTIVRTPQAMELPNHPTNPAALHLSSKATSQLMRFTRRTPNQFRKPFKSPPSRCHNLPKRRLSVKTRTSKRPSR